MDTTPAFESNLEARVAFKRLTGLNIRLTPWELLTRINRQSEDTIVVQIVTHEVNERKTQTILTGRGVRLIQYKLVDGSWKETFRLPVVWEPDFKPMTYSLFGPGKTPEEWLQAKLFEQMCYRPGSDRSPLDSCSRTSIGYTTPKMARHWGAQV